MNEILKNTTDLSTIKNIQNEIVLRAKRFLVHTTLTIQEIAMELGYEDTAYFTRLFTKHTSISPTAFRNKYLK